MILSKFPG